jgi:hypothetical protein
MQALDRVGGVDDATHLCRVGEERNHLFPVAPPGLRDRWVFAAPEAGIEFLEPFTGNGCGFGAVDRFEGRGDGFPFFPGGGL